MLWKYSITRDENRSRCQLDLKRKGEGSSQGLCDRGIQGWRGSYGSEACHGGGREVTCRQEEHI
jgi:hypothetical protein